MKPADMKKIVEFAADLKPDQLPALATVFDAIAAGKTRPRDIPAPLGDHLPATMTKTAAEACAAFVRGQVDAPKAKAKAKRDDGWDDFAPGKAERALAGGEKRAKERYDAEQLTGWKKGTAATRDPRQDAAERFEQAAIDEYQRRLREANRRRK